MDDEGDLLHRNEIVLVGTVAAAAVTRELPSGDQLSQLRLVVRRPAGRSSSRSTVDTVDCVAWSARTRRQVATWAVGDIVEVSGALRRRFWRTSGGAPASRYEVEVLAGRRRRRATMTT